MHSDRDAYYWQLFTVAGFTLKSTHELVAGLKRGVSLWQHTLYLVPDSK